MFYITRKDTPLGKLILASDGEYLTGAWFEGQKYFFGTMKGEYREEERPVFERAQKWLERYFAGEKPDIASLSLRPRGTAFQQAVWEMLCEIPYGEVTTYGAIAREIAKKDQKEKMSAQAVGQAVGHNPISVFIPCHRVVGTNGSLTGYAGGIERKVRLLEHEGADMSKLFVPKKKADDKLTQELKELLLSNGAALVGAGNVRELPLEMRLGFPTGVSVAVTYPKEVIQGIATYPTPEYWDWYGRLNEKLDSLVTLGANFLLEKGYCAAAKTRAAVGAYGADCKTVLPHKTVATRAGIGWIGKSALLVTEEYGSMVRISSILTDAPLKTEDPINASKCGTCTKCKDACPAGAIHGTLWTPSTTREELFDYVKCMETARERSEKGFGKREEICGKCIEICPYTRRYLREK